MPAATAPPRRALWGLWVFFTTATLGFVVLLAGLLDEQYRATLVGAGLMAFSTLVYLFIHFWTTAHASIAPDAVPEAAPVPRTKLVPVRPSHAQTPSDANPYNFDDLMGRTLERSPTSESIVPPAFAASAPTHEERLVAATAPAGKGQHIVPATQRRNEWIGGLPIMKQVLGEATAVTSPQRPGKTRGQCSNCQTILWAPLERPIRLRCPQCGKVAWLEK